MFNPTGLLVSLLFVAIGLYALSWVIRLGVRDGMGDAQRRSAGERPHTHSG